MVSSVDSEPQEAEDAPARPPDQPFSPARRDPWRGPLTLPALTLVIGLLVTLTLTLVSQSQYTGNENRLLRLRVRDASTLLTGTLPTTQTALGAAAELADVTGGNVSRFRAFVAQDVSGANPQFASVSLWRLDRTAAGPLTVVGATPKLAISRSEADAFFAQTARHKTLGVLGLLAPPAPSLGYGFVTGPYAVYAEKPLPASRRSRLSGNSAFAGLDYAIFLGATESPRQLLVTNVKTLPLPQPSAMQSVPYGDSSLTIAMSSRVPLAGTLPKDLPWIAALVGTLLSLAAAFMVWRLTTRRQAAEQLARRLEVAATENSRLYAEQRTIAQTLQHALLPDALPQGPWIEARALYEAGERGVEIGGDWYDVIDIDDQRSLLIVGDVSGRGLRAATTMASLRYAIRAYAAQGDGPPEILNKVSRLISVAETGQLATVLCVLVDVGRRTLSVTSAGHLPPLLVDGDGGRYLHGELGLPIGVEDGSTYASRDVEMPASGTLVAFTDGLVEKRGESIDDGLERLRTAAMVNHSELTDLLDRLVTEVPGGRSEDDIAIVGVRWGT